MITFEDCVAFCDADAVQVSEIAQREHLVQVMALACAHSHTVCANDAALPVSAFAVSPRLAA